MADPIPNEEPIDPAAGETTTAPEDRTDTPTPPPSEGSTLPSEGPTDGGGASVGGNATFICPTGKQFSRSPILIAINDQGTGNVLNNATISVKVWSGDKTAVPTTATFTLYAESQDGQMILIDLSDLINPDQLHSTGILTASADITLSPDGECLWVQVGGSYNHDVVGNPTNVTLSPVIFAAFDGFHEPLDGANYTADPYWWTDRPNSVTFDREDLVIPIKPTTNNTSFLVRWNNNDFLIPISSPFDTNLSEAQLLYLPIDLNLIQPIISAPINEIHAYKIVRVEGQSELAEHLVIVGEACKHEPIHLFFINKYGAMDQMTALGRHDISVSTTSTEFKPVVPIAISGSTISYDTTAHQTNKINIQSSKTMTLNTGFIDERFGEVISQIMESAQVWIKYKGDIVPVIMTDSGMQIRQQLHDRLINYTLNFKFAHDQIANIR